MTMIEVLKKEMNKSLKESYKNTNKPWSKMNKTVQDMNMEIKSIKKTQSGNEIFRNLTGTSEARITNRIHEMEPISNTA